MEVAKYLDFLHTVRVAKEDFDESTLTFDKIVHIAEVDHVYEIARNKQNVPTPLCKKKNSLLVIVGEHKDMLRLTQA